jgi:hypothetical protein
VPLAEEMVKWRTLGCNVAECGNVMYKSYLHNASIRRYQPDVLAAEKRTPFLSLHLIPGAQVDSKEAVLWYPKIEGSYVGQLSSQKEMLLFLGEVERLHKMGVVMGDIRRRNYIGSRMIDFDYSSCTKSVIKDCHEEDWTVPEEVKNRKYPPHWNLRIDDGGRHPQVKSGEPITVLHDLYAACRAILSDISDDMIKSTRFVGIASVAQELEGDLTEAEAKAVFQKLKNFLKDLKDVGYKREMA